MTVHIHVGEKGSGGSGTDNYHNLSNKPKINGVELDGNNTAAQLALQALLESGVNIKTINGQTILGSGNIKVGTGAVSEVIVTEFDPAVAYSARDLVFYEGNLYKFNTDHSAGAWNSSEVDQATDQDLLSYIVQGQWPGMTAGDITPKRQEAQVVTNKFAIQPTGGKFDLQDGVAMFDNIKGFLDAKNGPFIADTFVSTGMNLVDPSQYLTILERKAFYFPVPIGVWGEYGTTEENNGLVVVSSSTPVGVYFKPTKPTAASYGEPCSFHTHNDIKYYTPSEPGWLIVIMPDNTIPACHMAHSNGYDNEPGVFNNVVKSISAAITAVHPWGLALLTGQEYSVCDEVDFVTGKGYPRNDRNLLKNFTWEMSSYDDGDIDSPNNQRHYVFRTTVSGMKNGGVWDCVHGNIIVDGTTIVIESTSITNIQDLLASFGENEYFYYEKASYTPVNIANASAIRQNLVNDYGLSYFMYNGELVVVPAYVTEEFYQSGKDNIFNTIDYVRGEMNEVAASAFAFLQEQINSILYGIEHGFPSLTVQRLKVVRSMDAYIKEGNLFLHGSGAPTVIPQFDGQEYHDETNNAWYKASFTGTEPTSAVWILITNA